MSDIIFVDNVDNMMMMMNHGQMGHYHHFICDLLNFHLMLSRAAAETQQRERHGSLVHVEVFLCPSIGSMVEDDIRAPNGNITSNHQYLFCIKVIFCVNMIVLHR